MLKIHETTKSDGSLAPVYLRVADGDVELVTEELGDEGGAVVLPGDVLARVMTRYGAPLELGMELSEVDRLELGGGARIRHVRHLARYDVIAKDWLVYEAEGEEPLCALANTVATALGHLARAAPRTPEAGS